MIEYGDYLFYCDSGAYFINRLDHLVDSLELANQDIMGFVLPLLERQFTKKEAFVLMEFSDYSLNQVLSTYILFKKTDFTIQFVNEWLAYCCDQRIICPEHYLENVNEFEDFVSHREDQSVFSVLYHKYNLRAFKDPSQFGERPWEYSWRLKFATWSNRWIYRPVLTERSPYRKILVLYRRNKFLSFRIFEYMKNLLFILGIYNQHTFALIIKQGRSGGASLL